MSTSKLFLLVIPSACGILSAFYMAISNVSGWGWFLFIAIFCAPSYTETKRDDKT